MEKMFSKSYRKKGRGKDTQVKRKENFRTCSQRDIFPTLFLSLCSSIGFFSYGLLVLGVLCSSSSLLIHFLTDGAHLRKSNYFSNMISRSSNSTPELTASYPLFQLPAASPPHWAPKASHHNCKLLLALKHFFTLAKKKLFVLTFRHICYRCFSQ